MLEDIKRIFYRPDFFQSQSFTISQAFGFYSLTIFAFVLVKLFTTTAPLFQEWVDWGFQTLQTPFWSLLIIVPALLYIDLWITYLIFGLFGALIVWVTARVRGYTLRYGQAYRSTFYLLPAPFILSSFMSMAGYPAGIVFVFTFFVVTLLNFPKAEKLPDPVKIAEADLIIAPKDAGVEEKPSDAEEKK